MTQHSRDVSRRRLLFGGAAVGAATLLTACTSNETPAASTQTKAAGDGEGNNAPGKKVIIGFSAPAADHGWIGAIPPTPRRRPPRTPTWSSRRSTAARRSEAQRATLAR